MNWKEAVIVGALFNVFWFVCVIGQNSYLWLSAVLIANCWWFYRGSIIAGIVVGLLGITIDSVWYHAGLFVFPPATTLPQDALDNTNLMIPYWLMLLWIGFGSFVWVMRHTVLSYPKIIVIAFFTLGGAMSYLAGRQLEAVQWPFGVPMTFCVLLVTWSLLGTILVWLTACLSRRFYDLQLHR
ncbi:DUF2878 domain-containing protein [Photobacterium nomapromontoriensis]|uniref:DUF2878 domain-containing protein n=1 Tax=Photobacterium nomapromontoriensis TaxID=2910237 RepID=UPI003D13312B